jgi:short subunit dehydrogenase
MRSVVVTGTSTGIGWGTTKVLIARGFRVFGSVRKKADAERLSAEFGAAFVPLVFDVTDEDAVGRPRRASATRLPAKSSLAWSIMPALPSPGRCWNSRSTNSATRSISI